MTYFTAIDVSLRSVSICVVDESGSIKMESKVVADVEAIVAVLRKFSPEVRLVGFEAGTLTQYLTYGLRKAGYEVVCMEARQVAASLAAMRNKTDRNDARGLAQILRTGWYRSVHVKSAQSHQRGKWRRVEQIISRLTSLAVSRSRSPDRCRCSCHPSDSRRR